MMNRVVLTIAAALISFSAMAASPPGKGNGNGNGNGGGNDAPSAEATAVALAGQEQGQLQAQLQKQAQLQGQDQGQLQAQSSTSSAVNEGNAQNVTVNNNETNPDNIKLRNTPALYAPTVPATAPCLSSASGGIVLPGFGINGGKTKMDEECNLRQTSIAAWNAGLVEVGDSVFCYTKAIENTIGKAQCLQLVQLEREARNAAINEAATKQDLLDSEGRLAERLNRRNEVLSK